ncbi:MAG TPA: DUF1952 domain-containing protein [Thermoflexales bacterium]|nr:DUF1952 domain-containing protein [Thermoflexales bacterium]
MFSDNYETPLDVVMGGVPAWLMQEYFKDLGAQPGADGWYEGAGWRARATQVEPKKLWSLEVGQAHLEVIGDPAVLGPIRKKLELKLIRGGG